jgi:hypothetical protein
LPTAVLVQNVTSGSWNPLMENQMQCQLLEVCITHVKLWMTPPTIFFSESSFEAKQPLIGLFLQKIDCTFPEKIRHAGDEYD